jgi:uncharacterized membrane protein
MYKLAHEGRMTGSCYIHHLITLFYKSRTQIHTSHFCFDLLHLLACLLNHIICLLLLAVNVMSADTAMSAVTAMSAITYCYLVLLRTELQAESCGGHAGA